MAWFALVFGLLLLVAAVFFVRMAILNDGIFWVFVAIFVIAASAPLSAAFFGGHVVSSGTYVGIPNDIDEGGIFWHTIGVTLKTDRESSHLEGFCVVDPQVKADLIKYAEAGTRVKVEYESTFWWEDGCVLENTDVIRSVTPVEKQ